MIWESAILLMIYSPVFPIGEPKNLSTFCKSSSSNYENLGKSGFLRSFIMDSKSFLLSFCGSNLVILKRQSGCEFSTVKSYAKIAYPSRISILESFGSNPKHFWICGNGTRGIPCCKMVWKMELLKKSLSVSRLVFMSSVES